MLLIVILLTLFTFITYVYVKWMHVTQYWAKRQVPYAPPHPLLGSLTFLLKENPAIYFRRLYNNFKEPYIGIWIFWRPAVIVNSTEIAKNILIKDQANFRNRLASSGITDPVGRLNLFSLYDPLWTVIRRRLTIFFTSSKLRAVQNLVTIKSKELIERIEKERQNRRPINLRCLMTDFSTDIIGTSSFGLVSNATLNGTSHMRRVTEEFMKFNIFRGLSWCSCFFLPELCDFFRFKMFQSTSTEYMRTILRNIIAQRGGMDKEITEPRDLLDILIKIKQESGEELDMTENLMLAQAVAFLQGGFDTTAITLSFAIYELAFRLEVQERLNKELQEANDTHGDNLLDATVLSHLTFLNCVINEIFRKYPVFGWLDRIALEDYKIDDHLTIKAGTPVLVNVVGLHYDPKFYPVPDVFNPNRFLPENKIDANTFAFLPFGEGPRKCIGQRFGLSSVRHGLAAIMLNYELRPLPNTPTPADLKLERKGLLTAPGEILSVEFVPRNKM